jgi:glycosyltransferase involved in cell wall biosynthesis
MDRLKGKSILMIIPNLEYGGAQLSFVKLCRELAVDNKLFVVAFYLPATPAYDIPGETIDLGVAGSSSPLAKISNYFKRKRKIKAIKRDKKIDIAVSFMEGACYMNSATKGRERIIFSIRGAKEADATITGFKRKLHYNYLIPKHFKRADHITVVNRGIEKEVTDFLGIQHVPITYIPNYYDSEALEQKANEAIDAGIASFLNSGKKTLYSFGRFGLEKGFHHLIEVFAKLKENNVQMMLVGSGPMKSNYIEACQRLGISFCDLETKTTVEGTPDLLFVGFDENPLKYARKSDVFALTSASEGFPNALIEAMSTGVCCVSTDCPFGPREIFAPGTKRPQKMDAPEYAEHGILLPEFTQSNAIDIWADALKELFSNDEKRKNMGTKSRARVADFSKAPIMKLWENVLLGE